MRSSLTGKSEQTEEDLSYKEWYQKYVVDQHGQEQADILQKMAKNESQDFEQYQRYKATLGKDFPAKTFAEFQNLKYNRIDEWHGIKSLYRDVNWQLKAQGNIISDSVHQVPFKAEPNSVFDNYKDGVLTARRYYGNTGKPRLDIDLTNHGNSVRHPIVPHAHGWNDNSDKIEDVKREKSWRELTKAERIANKELL